MKRVLVIAAVLMVMGSLAYAQTPNVQVVYDEGYTTQTLSCAQGEIHIAYIVARNFNAFISAIEYNVEYGVGVQKFGEIPVSELVIGSTDDYTNGFQVAWDLPQNAYQPVLTHMVSVKCLAGCFDTPITVIPNVLTGFVRATNYPDNDFVYGIGLTSIVCPETIPTENSTWGGVKALYE